MVENDRVPFDVLNSGFSFNTSGFFSSAESSRFKICNKDISITTETQCHHNAVYVPLGLGRFAPEFRGQFHRLLQQLRQPLH